MYSHRMGTSDWSLHLIGGKESHIETSKLGKYFLNNFHNKLLKVWLNKICKRKLRVLLGLAFEMCVSSLSHQRSRLNLYQNELSSREEIILKSSQAG